jgi:hypothetical protein
VQATVFIIQIYVDNTLKYQQNGKTIDAHLAMGSGRHYLVVQAWDNGGGIWKSGLYVNVK